MLFLFVFGRLKESGYSRETEPNRMFIHIEEIYYKELAHTVREIDRSQDLRWASWELTLCVPGQRLAGLGPRRADVSI